MSIRGLPRGNRAKVFLRIVQQLKTDPVLSTVVKSWDVWDGQGADQMPDNIMSCPYIKLLPRLGQVDWYSPDAQFGSMEIQIQMGVEGFDALDCLDLWDAFERAIYPFDDRAKQLDFEQQLRDDGCETGQITFSTPATIQQMETANVGIHFTLIGTMRVQIIRPFNP